MGISQKRALIVASVASMIDLFNREEIDILLKKGYSIDVAANFSNGSITDQNRVDAFANELNEMEIGVYNVPITRSVKDVKGIVRSYRELTKIIDKGQYSIVHCQSPIGGVICRKACKKVRKSGTRVVYEAHGFHFFKGASAMAWLLYYPIEKHYSRYTDCLLTMNEEDFKRAEKMHSGKVRNISGIGVHTSEIREKKPDSDVIRTIRKQFGFDENDFVFLSVGQISERKNHRTVIEALSKIDDRRIKYLIVGFGELEAELKDLAEKLKVSDRVVFAGYRSDVFDIMYSVDGFVFPSKQEGLPVSLMEAMTIGLPIVCSRIRGNVDLIKDGEGGFLCDYSDGDCFAVKMIEIADESGKGCELREKMRLANADTMNRFDVSVVRRQLEDILAEVTAEKGE